ncbi:MAG: Redoxin domain protein [Verrucomicrobiales bacterium]|nr:Redoxin domain protein [Verrucomicrobiales bacterium]
MYVEPMDRSRKRSLPFILVLLLALAGCEKQNPTVAGNPPGAGSTTNYMVNGVIVGLTPGEKKVRIRHEAITNYMDAMTMPFQVKDASILADLQTNDPVRFQLTISETEGWISKIEKRKDAASGTNTTTDPVRPATRIVREVEPLKVGEVMPPYPFTNQLGQAINLKDFKGQAVGLTFIFTLCPMPQYCPRLSANFLSAMKLLKADASGPTNWHLLSISFDPDRDTPPVLLSYAKRYNYDPIRWSFVTGAQIEIDAITEQFELPIPYNAETRGFDHKMRTVIIDAAGKVDKIYVGNEWKVEEFVEEMKKAAMVK